MSWDIAPGQARPGKHIYRWNFNFSTGKASLDESAARWRSETVRNLLTQRQVAAERRAQEGAKEKEGKLIHKIQLRVNGSTVLGQLPMGGEGLGWLDGRSFPTGFQRTPAAAGAHEHSSQTNIDDLPTSRRKRRSGIENKWVKLRKNGTLASGNPSTSAQTHVARACKI